MKFIVFIFLLIPGLFDKSVANSSVVEVHDRLTMLDCDMVPELNKRVINFVNTKIKKKVGRGECWDLANEALQSIDATWDGRYKFGRLVDHKTECVYPGDIMQFENVKSVIKDGSRTDYQEFPHHTAIIYEVKGQGKFVLAHQNTTFSGKKVGLSDLDLATVTKGKIKIYRPVK